MKRVPEPDLMNGVEQARAYAEADFSEPHDSFVSHFTVRFPDFSQGLVLDLGSGTGDVLIRLARALPRVRITGIDGAEAMLAHGRRAVRQHSLTERVVLHSAFLPVHNMPEHRYDAIISNSLLHHLEDPLVLWTTVRQFARTGAAIFIMDLLRPRDVESARRMVENYADGESPILKKDFFNSLLAAYGTEEVRSQLNAAEMNYLSLEIISDRHFIVWGNFSE